MERTFCIIKEFSWKIVAHMYLRILKHKTTDEHKNIKIDASTKTGIISLTSAINTVCT